MSDLASLKARIAALRAKTSAAGCSEAEAMAAAEAVARLMASHGITETDLVMEEARAVLNGPKTAHSFVICSVISGCTNTAAVSMADAAIVYFGRQPGPEIAVYLTDICHRALRQGLAEFMASPFYRRRRTTKTKTAARADFKTGMETRLAARLQEMFRTTRSDKAKAEAQGYLDSRHPNTRAHKLRQRETRFDEAKNAGWRAGGDVALSHGVGRQQAATRLIERASS